jgi:hypothetical protein
MQLAILCWDGFDLFIRFVFRQVPVSSIRCFGDDGLQACVAWGVLPADVDDGLQACVAWGVLPADVLSAFARSRCKQLVVFAVFKNLYGDSVCRCSFPLLPFQCIFQASVDDELWKEEDNHSTLQCNFIFFVSLCVKLSFCSNNFITKSLWLNCNP